MMPILRVRSRETVLAICLSSEEKKEAVEPPPFSPISAINLPPVMCKGSVRLSHTMGIFFFLDSRSAIVRCVQNFCSQLFFHRFFAAIARRLDQPTHAQ